MSWGQFTQWLSQAGSGYSNVDGSRIDVAQQAVAIRSAVDLLASICSELPIDIYRGKGAARTEVPMPSYLEDPAGDGYGLPDWLYQVVTSWLYRGNLYGEVLEAGPAGLIRQMSLFHPDCVSGWVDDNGNVRWQVNGRDADAGFRHFRVNAMAGHVLGVSPIAVHADTIGVALAASRFGKSWFDSEAHPLGILRNTESAVNSEQAGPIKQKFMAALRGGPSGREPIVMGRAYEWTQLQVNPEESQFLGTLGYSATECARIFGPGIAEILGYETGGSQTYANLQDRDLQLLKYSVNKWLRRLERLLFLFLPRPQYAVFNRDALLETNTLQRYQAYASALGNTAWKTIDEVREKENLPPVPGGDDLPGTSAPAPAPTNTNNGNNEGVPA